MIKNVLKKTWIYQIYLSNRIKRSYNDEINNNTKVRGPLISEFIPKNGVGAELGVLQGNFSGVLLEFAKPMQLHFIDPWYFLDSHWSWAGGNQSTIDAVIKILNERKSEIENKQVFMHIQDDLKVLNLFEDNYFDWVYIDSSHAYEHTKSELEILKSKVKRGGIICGDDWRPDSNHRHHRVYKAVNEFLSHENYSLLYANDINLQWFIKKND